MASARAALGKARRGIIKRQKKTDVVTGALSAVGTVAAFGVGQAKKAKTAWGEYEAGYEALGGEGFERPKFGQKGYFKGPEGEVSIGEGKLRRTYDRGQIQKAGSFLGSDAAAVLSPEMRQQYLERTAPGRADPLTGKLQSSLTHMTGDTGTGFGKGLGRLGTGGYTTGISDTLEGEGYRSGVGMEFGTVGQGKGMRVQQDPTADYRSRMLNAQTPQYQEQSLGSKVKEWGVTGASAVVGAGLAATGGIAPGLTLMGPMFGKLSEKYTDKQRQPYLNNPKRSYLDTWEESGKKRY